MTHPEQKKFIRELCDNVRDSLLAKVKDHPTTWDGHELRRLMAKRFTLAVMGSISRTRMLEFENELLVKNIL